MPGNPTAPVTIVGRALPLADGETRPQLLHLSGLIEAHTGSVQEAYAVLVDAADARHGSLADGRDAGRGRR